MSFYFRPIIPITMAMIAGIMAGEWFPDHRWPAWCLGAVCLAFQVFLVFRKKGALMLPMVVFFALGYLLIQPWTAPRFPSEHILYSATGKKILVTGVLVTSPVTSGFRQSFIIETESLGGKTSRKPTCGKLRVSLSGREPVLRVGDRIFFVGRIRPIRSFRNPGGFDYNRYLAFKGVWATASGQGESVTIQARSVPVGLDVWVSPTRESVATLIDDVSSKDAAGILKALLLGDRRSVSDALRTDFQQSGIGHLLAISGLHVGLVATVIFFLFSRIFGYVPVLLRRAWTKKAAAFPAFLGVLGYGLLAGMSPSTERAVIMVSVLLAAFLLHRPQDTLNSVAAAALVILIIQPPALFSVSFQLSFGAVTTILLCIGIFTTQKPDTLNARPLWRRAFRRIFLSMLVSLAAILGTLPMALYYFNETSLIGLFSNLVFIPIIGFGVVPLGLLSVFLYPLNASLAAAGLKLCSIILSKALPGVHWTASLPFSAVKIVTPSVVEIILYYCLLVSVGLLVRAYMIGREQKAERRGRRIVFRLGIVFAAVAVIGFISDGLYWGYRRFWSNRMRVTIMDVGHGSAGLVEFPGGETMLIDGGGFSSNTTYDVGRRIVAPLLWRKKIRTVRTVVVSHPDSDHVNGLIYIARHFHVAQILSNNEPADTKGYGELMSVVREMKIDLADFESLDRNLLVGNAEIDILYPLPGFMAKRKAEPWRDTNNNSMVLKVTYDAVSFLFPGDIMADGESELVAASKDTLSSTVLAAPHHGSRSSSTWMFLQQVDPDVIVVSSAWNDEYGGIHPEVHNRYSRLNARIFSTAEDGAVTFTTDGDTLWVKKEK